MNLEGNYKDELRIEVAQNSDCTPQDAANRVLEANGFFRRSLCLFQMFSITKREVKKQFGIMDSGPGLFHANSDDAAFHGHLLPPAIHGLHTSRKY